MDNQEARHVVVGVDGTQDNMSALQYAAMEAASLDATLRLVHVVPDDLPFTPIAPRKPVDFTQAGTAVLDLAAARLNDLYPQVTVEGLLRRGTRATQLARAAEGAESVVVGRDEHPLLERWLHGDTATAVAARAPVAVVEVPAEWKSQSHAVVLAGVKSAKQAAGLLGDAFELAQRRRSRLVLLHAWKLPSVYDDLIAARVDLDEWKRNTTVEMEALVQESRSVYPDVQVEFRVVHDHPGHALVEASRDADVVIIARREHGVPAAAQLGGTARAVLHASHCPVRVVPMSVSPPLRSSSSGP